MCVFTAILFYVISEIQIVEVVKNACPGSARKRISFLQEGFLCGLDVTENHSEFRAHVQAHDTPIRLGKLHQVQIGAFPKRKA